MVSLASSFAAIPLGLTTVDFQMDRRSTFPTHPRLYDRAEAHVQQTLVARNLLGPSGLCSCHREWLDPPVPHPIVVSDLDTGALALLDPAHCVTDAVIFTLPRALELRPP